MSHQSLALRECGLLEEVESQEGGVARHCTQGSRRSTKLRWIKASKRQTTAKTKHGNDDHDNDHDKGNGHKVFS